MFSQVAAHAELMWILSCTASMGYLSRMTQWKVRRHHNEHSEVFAEDVQSKLALPDKASPTDRNTKAKLKLGLFSYPVLQAADILVHGWASICVVTASSLLIYLRATHVPVGEDQVQHLEFARECANNFNSMHGTVLKEPQVLLCAWGYLLRGPACWRLPAPAKRVMSLKEPHLKMSKSHEDPRSRILLTDSHVDVQRKIRLALTDSTSGVSYDPLNRPGVANLLSIMSHLDEQGRSCQELANLYSSMSMRDFKEEVTNRISESFAGIRARYDRIVEDEGVSRLEEVASTGAERAARNAQNTMIVVRDALGFWWQILRKISDQAITHTARFIPLRKSYYANEVLCPATTFQAVTFPFPTSRSLRLSLAEHLLH